MSEDHNESTSQTLNEFDHEVTEHHVARETVETALKQWGEEVLPSKSSKGNVKKDKSKTRIEKEKQLGKKDQKRLEKNRLENRRKFSKKIKTVGGRYKCRCCLFMTVFAAKARKHALSSCGEQQKEPENRQKRNTSVICIICKAKFPSKKQFNKHNAAEHVRGIPCSTCGKVLKNKRTQLKHLFYVHGNRVKKHFCKNCDYKTHRKEDLARHLKRKHSADTVTRPVIEARSLLVQGPERAKTLSEVTRMQKMSRKFFLLCFSSGKVQLVELQDTEMKVTKDASCVINFEITDIVVPFHFTSMAAVVGRNDVVLLSFSSDGALLSKREVPAVLLPQQVYQVCWVPNNLVLGILGEDSITTIDVQGQMRCLNTYKAVDSEPLLAATFSDYTIQRNGLVFAVGSSGKIYLGDFKDSEEGTIILTRQIQVRNKIYSNFSGCFLRDGSQKKLKKNQGCSFGEYLVNIHFHIFELSIFLVCIKANKPHPFQLS